MVCVYPFVPFTSSIFIPESHCHLHLSFELLSMYLVLCPGCKYLIFSLITGEIHLFLLSSAILMTLGRREPIKSAVSKSYIEEVNFVSPMEIFHWLFEINFSSGEVNYVYGKGRTYLSVWLVLQNGRV